MVKRIQYMSPSDIRFTQDSISHEFGNKSGQTLEETFTELLYGIKHVNDIQHLAAVEEDGLLWVVSGNRRLYLYKRLERHGIIDTIPVLIIPKTPDKFAKMKTTVNNGTNVTIRSDRSHPVGEKLSDRLDRIYDKWNADRRRPATFNWNNAFTQDSGITFNTTASDASRSSSRQTTSRSRTPTSRDRGNVYATSPLSSSSTAENERQRKTEMSCCTIL